VKANAEPVDSLNTSIRISTTTEVAIARGHDQNSPNNNDNGIHASGFTGAETNDRLAASTLEGRVAMPV
jgi:hypothetical protein